MGQIVCIFRIYPFLSLPPYLSLSPLRFSIEIETLMEIDSKESRNVWARSSWRVGCRKWFWWRPTPSIRNSSEVRSVIRRITLAWLINLLLDRIHRILLIFSSIWMKCFRFYNYWLAAKRVYIKETQAKSIERNKRATYIHKQYIFFNNCIFKMKTSNVCRHHTTTTTTTKWNKNSAASEKGKNTWKKCKIVEAREKNGWASIYIPTATPPQMPLFTFRFVQCELLLAFVFSQTKCI